MLAVYHLTYVVIRTYFHELMNVNRGVEMAGFQHNLAAALGRLPDVCGIPTFEWEISKLDVL